MKGKKSARGFASVQSRDLQDLDVLGVDLEVRGQQPAQFLRIAAFAQGMRQFDDSAPLARVRGFSARDKVRVIPCSHGYSVGSRPPGGREPRHRTFPVKHRLTETPITSAYKVAS